MRMHTAAPTPARTDVTRLPSGAAAEWGSAHKGHRKSWGGER